jgi:hypothetical protein
MRLTNRLLAGLAAGVAALAFIAPAAAQETGGITGTFVLKGEMPEVPSLAPQITKDQQVCANPVPPNEKLIVDPQTKGIANVFVWIAKIDANKIPKELQKPEKDEISLDNQGCRFVPHCILAREGQTVVLLNSDAVGHNVHPTPLTGGGSFNQLIAPNEKEGIKKPVGKKQILPIPVKCDIHPWMLAHMLILDHPYAALTDAKGEFTIEGLPPGKYDLKVWHEGGGYVGFTSKGIQGIEVVAGKPTELGKKEIDVKEMKQVK